MAIVRVMYWKEVPVQVQATANGETATVPLDDRFQEGTDALSMFDGSYGSDAYLDAWAWGDGREVPGSAAEAAARTAERYNAQFPRDFIARIRRLHVDGTRSAQAGAQDHWLDAT